MTQQTLFSLAPSTVIFPFYWVRYFNFISHLASVIAFSITTIISAHAQIPVKYDIFSRTPFSQLEIRLPQPATFQQLSSSSFNNGRISQPAIPNPSVNLNPMGVDVQEKNRRLIQEQEAITNMYAGDVGNARLQKELMEDDFYRRHIDWLTKTQYYQRAYEQLKQMNPDSFSIIKAVYIVENAYLENKYSFNEFAARMQLEAKIVQQQLRNEKLSTRDNTALNYGIQKRFRQGMQYNDVKNKRILSVNPYRYDFEDYMGKKDYQQMFVTKMIISGKGQCHSMPLMYLMIAEALGAKAWLSLAPQHSYIQFQDTKSRLFNFETTNGNLASSTWLAQSGYINAKAVKNKIYLDTLSQKQLYAQCLADLLSGYLQKFNYDEFAKEMQQNILKIDPSNMQALIVDAMGKRSIALAKITAVGKPKEEDLSQYPDAYQAYLDMKAALDKLDDMGFQDMPPEAYQKWLKSIEQEKKKQENREIQEKLQREIEYMKKFKSKPTLVDKTRG